MSVYILHGSSDLNAVLKLGTISAAAEGTALFATGEAAEGAAIKITLFGQSLSLTPLGAFITVAVIAVTVLAALAHQAEEARKKTIELNKEQIEQSNKIQ